MLAVEPGYPFYGTIETAPAGEWARLAESGGAIVEPSLLTMLGAAVGDKIALGEARFAVRATIVSAPGDVGLRSAFGPRVFVPRAPAGETGLLARGSRARYEAYLRFPDGTDASGSPTASARRCRPSAWPCAPSRRRSGGSARRSRASAATWAWWRSWRCCSAAWASRAPSTCSSSGA